MPTRVERLEKRKDKVRKKALSKVAKAKAAGKPATALAKGRRADRKLGNLKKKITKTKDRVAKRAVIKDARVLKRATKASTKYKSVKANPKSSKGKIKRATNRLNRLGKKAGGDKVMYPSMSYMDTFPKKKKK